MTESYKNEDPVYVVDTSDMDNKTWLATREHGIGKDPKDPNWIPITIGASSASIPLGLNPWVSDAEWRDGKMGIKPQLAVEFNEENKTAGHVFEPYVGYNFLRQMHRDFPEAKVNLWKDMFRDTEYLLKDCCPNGQTFKNMQKALHSAVNECMKLWKLNPSGMYQCGTKNPDGTLRYPFLLINLDGLVEVNGKLGVWEAKTTSSKSHAVNDYWMQGKVPPYYFVQLMCEMAVMNLDFSYITCIWGPTLNDTVTILVKRDLQEEEKLLEFLRQYVADMAAGLPLEESKSDPNIVSQYYFRLYGAAKGKPNDVILPDYCGKMVEQAISLENDITAAEKKLEDLKKQRASIYNEFHPIMGDASYAKITMADKSVYGVKLKTPKKRPVFDTERFKTENPELAKEFTEESINTSALDKKYKGMKKKYTLPAEDNAEGSPSFEIFSYENKAE